MSEQGFPLSSFFFHVKKKALLIVTFLSTSTYHPAHCFLLFYKPRRKQFQRGKLILPPMKKLLTLACSFGAILLFSFIGFFQQFTKVTGSAVTAVKNISENLFLILKILPLSSHS